MSVLSFFCGGKKDLKSAPVIFSLFDIHREEIREILILSRKPRGVAYNMHPSRLSHPYMG